MIWLLGVPVVLWAGKKLYDAATSDSDGASDYSPEDEAKARSRERQAQRQLALERARLLLRGYLHGQGIEPDHELDRQITRSELKSEVGRNRLLEECMRRFEETPEMMELAAEIGMEEVSVVKLRVDPRLLRTVALMRLLEQLTLRLEKMGK